MRFAPQSRPRVFLVARRAQPQPGSAAQLLSRPSSLLPDRLRKSLLCNLDLGWFCSQIPAPPPLFTSGLSEIVELLDDSDPRWWTPDETQRHLDMMKEPHRARIEYLRQSDTIRYRTFYRRIRENRQRAEVRDDDLAGCLRTAVGGSGKQFLIQAGKGIVRMRTMTPREYARLQGVPDHYPIHADGVQALTGFGDAVCVPVITWIAQNVLSPLTSEFAFSKSSQIEFDPV